MTLVSNLSPRILRILVRPVSTSLRMAAVTSYCRPVYSTFMSAPPRNSCIELNRALHLVVGCWSLVVCSDIDSCRQTCQRRTANDYFLTRRWCVLGMHMSSRYLATVRRVT